MTLRISPLLLTLSLFACGGEHDHEHGPCEDDDGLSGVECFEIACDSYELDGQLYLECPDGTVLGPYRGQDGQDGADGQDGQDGQDGADGQDGQDAPEDCGVDYSAETALMTNDWQTFEIYRRSCMDNADLGQVKCQLQGNDYQACSQAADEQRYACNVGYAKNVSIVTEFTCGLTIMTVDDNNGIHFAPGDADGDGVSNQHEFQLGYTNPCRPLSFGDCISDGDRDSDGDGIPDKDDPNPLCNWDMSNTKCV